MPSLGNSQLAMKAPIMPMTMSPMMPKPAPRPILPASQPATKPTNRMTIRLSLEIYIELPLLVRVVAPAPVENLAIIDQRDHAHSTSHGRGGGDLSEEKIWC